MSYPISPTLINVLYFDTLPGGLGKPLSGPSVSAASKAEILELYKDWEEDIHVGAEVRIHKFDTQGPSIYDHSLQSMGEVSKWAISQIRGLPQYVDKRVALVGDSVCTSLEYFVLLLNC